MNILKVLEFARLGVRNLLGYPMRTFLTTLGVIFGVGSVIAMLALGAGAEAALLSEIGRLGTNNIIINSVKPTEQANKKQGRSWTVRYGITYKDFDQILTTIPAIEQVLPVHHSRKKVWKGSQVVESTVYAVKPEHQELFGLNVSKGRGLSEGDARDLSRVCVVRGALLRDLGFYGNPIGVHLVVGDNLFRVIGVLDDSEFLGYAAKALAIDAKTTEIYVPYETVRDRVGTRSVIQGAGSYEATDVELSQLVIRADIDNVVMVSRMLKQLMENAHEDQDYEIVVPLEVLAQRRKTQQVFNIALVAIASISLLVGGIGIANIMLATVTERTKEIGIRRALGAKRVHILIQFLLETTAISTLGGVMGILLGFGLVEVLSSFTGWSAIIKPGSVLLAVSISIAVGVLSGIFPARRAALLDPIQALRHE